MRIVISGASRGIGLAIAEHFRRRGDEVFCLARNASPTCNVAIWDEVVAARDEVAKTWDSLDAIICAAAIQGEIGPAMTANPARWTEAVRINLDGTFHVIRAFWGLLQKAPRRGKVVCFSGGGATKARPNFSAYAASKTAVVRLVENLAAEWSDLAVDINAIAPGAINTDMTRETAASGAGLAGEDEYRSAIRQLAEGGQSIEKAVGLVDWLLSPDSDGVSGRLLSAQWDAWGALATHRAKIADADIYQLRRILPKERGLEL